MKLFFKIIIIYLFFFKNLLGVEFIGKFEQGSFILGKTKPDTKIKVDDKNVRITKEGYFAFGLGRDRKNNVVIKINENGNIKIIEKKILKREYKIQRIDGLSKKHVTNK